jgi:hypothetical protein
MTTQRLFISPSEVGKSYLSEHFAAQGVSVIATETHTDGAEEFSEADLADQDQEILALAEIHATGTDEMERYIFTDADLLDFVKDIMALSV